MVVGLQQIYSRTSFFINHKVWYLMLFVGHTIGLCEKINYYNDVLTLNVEISCSHLFIYFAHADNFLHSRDTSLWHWFTTTEGGEYFSKPHATKKPLPDQWQPWASVTPNPESIQPIRRAVFFINPKFSAGQCCRVSADTADFHLRFIWDFNWIFFVIKNHTHVIVPIVE